MEGKQLDVMLSCLVSVSKTKTLVIKASPTLPPPAYPASPMFNIHIKTYCLHTKLLKQWIKNTKIMDCSLIDKTCSKKINSNLIKNVIILEDA